MIKTFKYEIYPNANQRRMIRHMILCSYFVYNFLLDSKIRTFNITHRVLDFKSDIKFLDILVMNYPKLRLVDSSILISSIYSLNRAFYECIRTNKGFPRKKLLNKSRHSILIYNKNEKDIHSGNRFSIAGLQNIKTNKKLKHQGKIISASISFESNGKYFISLYCEVNSMPQFKKTNKAVGIDMGIKNFLTTDSGIKISNPYFYKNYLEKYRSLQRDLSKKVVGSNNWKKTRKKVAKVSLKIKNKRKDFLHKLSTSIIKRYDIICIENINLKDLMQKKRNSMEISTLAWYEFTSMLEYKAKWYGKKVIKVNRWFPSSQICSNCGYRNFELKNPKIKQWTCPRCGIKHDRDVNAAKNILNQGLRQL